MVGTPSFIFGGNTGETPESLKRKRQIADALLRSNAMPQNVGQGIAAIGDALAGRYLDNKVTAAEDAGKADASKLFGGIDFSAPAYPESVAAGGSPTAPAATGVEGPEAYRNAIASIESAGSGDYSAVGPTNSKMGRALGRYQIMEANIGPWSQEALGRAVTPDEFLKNPKIQDAIFDAKFGGYVQKYGPEGAAQAWFAGPGGVGKTGRKDVLGTSVGDYGSKFTAALGRAPQRPVQTASLDPSAGMAETAPPPVQPSPDVTAALQPPIQPQQGNVGVAGVPAGSGGTPVLDVTQVPQLSAAAGLPFAGGGAPTVASSLIQPQATPQPQQSVSDALLRKNDMALGGIMAPAGTPQPANAKLGGAFPAAPVMTSVDSAAPAQQGYFPPAPSAQSGPTAEQLIAVINHPYASETQKALAANELKRLQDQNDPDKQLDRRVKELQLKKAEKDLNGTADGWDYKVVDKRLIRTKGDKVEDVTPAAPEAPGGGKFRFEGTSVDAQALNGLIDSGVLTEQQAQELAVSKQVTDPTTGAITLILPSGVFRKEANSDTLTPVKPPASGGPATTSAPATSGVVPLTGPKTEKLTEGERKNQSLYYVIKPELKIVEDNFGALADTKNQAYSKLPFSEYITTPEYQKAANSLQTIISSYLYSVSGATATPDEVKKQTDILLPRPGEPKESLASKKRRIRTMVNAVAKSGGLPPEQNDLPDGVTEDDIQETMRVNKMTREQVMEKLNGGS